jgi:hypothetical protein
MLDDIIIDNDDGPDTKVKASFTEGYGLFAGRDFSPGEVVINYGLFPDSWFPTTYEELTDEQRFKNLYVMLDSERCIATHSWSKFSYINHSRKPNCVWNLDEKLVIASKNITRGDELFIDYRLEPLAKGLQWANWI